MDRIKRALDTASVKTFNVANRLSSSSQDLAAIIKSHASSIRSSYLLDDKIVLDFGAMYTKIGFASDPRPRFVIPTKKHTDQPLFWTSGFLNPAQLQLLEQDLTQHLTDIFFTYLLVNPNDKALIVTEPVFMPLLFKHCLTRILFAKFKIASLCYIPSELAVTLTSGQGTALVVECGHTDCTVTPVFDYQVIHTSSMSLPLANACILNHLKDLLIKFGSLVVPMDVKLDADTAPTNLSYDHDLHQSVSLASESSYWSTWSNWALDIPSTQSSSTTDQLAFSAGVGHNHTTVPWTDAVVDTLLTPAFMDDLKSRLVFVGQIALESESVLVPEPIDHTPTYPSNASPFLIRQYTVYRSGASSVYFPVGTFMPHAKLVVPGWIRERASEPLFVGDSDNQSIASLVLNVLLKCPRDVRAGVAMNIIVSGGTTLLPGFFDRLEAEIMLLLETEAKYTVLLGLMSLIQVVPPGHGQFVYGPWVGASLAASLKILDQNQFITRQIYDNWCVSTDPSNFSWLIKDWTSFSITV